MDTKPLICMNLRTNDRRSEMEGDDLGALSVAALELISAMASSAQSASFRVQFSGITSSGASDSSIYIVDILESIRKKAADSN